MPLDLETLCFGGLLHVVKAMVVQGKGQSEEECTARSRFTFDPDPTAVRLYDSSHDRQAEPSPQPGGSALGLPETLKEMGAILV